MDQENRAWQWAAHLIMIVLSIACVLPFILLFMASITDESAIVAHGYTLFPSAFSFDAYDYLWKQSDQIFHAYGITVLITVIGTAGSLALTSMLAYPLSRRDLPGGQALAFVVFFTLLFNGGLVPTYMVYTQVFHLKNTLFALLVPWLLMNGFNVLLMRTFFSTTIPAAVLESASIDGSGEFRTYARIVLPLSMPILATVGMFQGLGYWNDWNNGLVFVTNPDLFSLQNLLNRIMSDIQFLTTNSRMGTTQALSQLPGETFRMAIAVVGVVPILAAYPFFQKYFVKGMTIGAVKG